METEKTPQQLELDSLRATLNNLKETVKLISKEVPDRVALGYRWGSTTYFFGEKDYAPIVNILISNLSADIAEIEAKIKSLEPLN